MMVVTPILHGISTCSWGPKYGDGFCHMGSSPWVCEKHVQEVSCLPENGLHGEARVVLLVWHQNWKLPGAMLPFGRRRLHGASVNAASAVPCLRLYFASDCSLRLLVALRSGLLGAV